MSDNISLSFSSTGTAITAVLLWGGVAIFKEFVRFHFDIALAIILIVLGLDIFVTILQIIFKVILKLIE